MVGKERVYSAEVERTIAAPHALVWALLADTNRWDRAIGFKRSVYTYEELTPGDAGSRASVGRTRMMGMDVSWIEIGEAFEARFVSGERQFLTGPVTRAGFRCRVAPEGAKTALAMSSYVAGGETMPEPLGEMLKERAGAALVKYLDAIEALLARCSAETMTLPPDVPPLSFAHRLLMTAPPDPLTTGPRSPVDEEAFAFRAMRLDDAPVDGAIKGAIAAFVHDRPDEELRQIRPFEVARALGLDRREVLRGFLYAARAGLVDLCWQLVCPSCRVAAEHATSLEHVRRAAHCADCDIPFDLDFAENVEAIFTVSPAVRKVDSVVYCASSPWYRPHVFAGVRTMPGASREICGPLPPGAFFVRALPGTHKHAMEIGEVPPERLEVRVTEGGIELIARGAGAAESALCVENATSRPVTVQVERAGAASDIVRGSVIATFPEFIDLFATEAPAAGVDLTVGALTVLFSDLTGTTALYRKLGDARAFALVEEHFIAMTSVIEAHEGAIVKTMGDAVMATFATPGRAFEAALDMVRAVNESERAASHGLSIKIGLNEGPCIAVRANGRLDFFGTTVNVAARLQTQARGSEIIVLTRMLEHPDIACILEGRALEKQIFRAELKGLEDVEHVLVVIRAAEDRT